MATKIVFISQPMNGLSDEDINKERERLIAIAAASFPDDEVLVADNICHETYDPERYNVPLARLAHSLFILSQCNLAIFAPGWKETRGCTIEYEACMKYGIETYEASPIPENNSASENVEDKKEV